MSFDREYRTVDRTGWPPGPWDDEPDKAQWVDEATGLDCLIVRNSPGALCGYVGVPAEHPWHGRHYDALSDVDVHGGLTYADRCQEGEGVEEAESICHVPLPGRPSDVWWFGFDCAHFNDVTPGLDARLSAIPGAPARLVGYAAYRTVDYVQAECARLARQLAVGGSDGS